MAMLEDTPYRVYYLIDKNKDKFRRLRVTEPSLNSSISEDDEQISIRALLNTENKFDSVKLAVSHIYEDYTYEYYNYDSHRPTYNEYMWNNIDDKVVGIIKNYYQKHEDEYQRIVKYADMIQAMYENPENISFTCDNEGRPRLVISGLPYINDGEVCDISLTISGLNDTYYHICLNDRDSKSKLHSNSFDNHTLEELINKSSKYDQMKDGINGFLDEPDILSRLLASLRYNYGYN